MNNMKIRLLFISILAAVLNSCASSGANYKAMAERDPEGLLSMKDSLLTLKSFLEDTSKINTIVVAHLAMAEKHEASGEIDLAVSEADKAVSLNPKHKKAQYIHYMLRGRVNYDHGNVWKLWEAITLYTRASEVFPKKGEPWYWIGRSYEKKDGRDFESILESYNAAISLLPEGALLDDAQARVKRIQKEKNTFENFWR